MGSNFFLHKIIDLGKGKSSFGSNCGDRCCFYTFRSELGLTRSPPVIIIVIKVITNGSLGVQQEIDPHHGNDTGEQRVAEGR